MIGYFPTPFPDELWYSICARFSDHMQFGTETGVMQALYGRRHAVATVDLPHRLGAIVSQLPTGHPCAVDAIIDQHTFLPYYSPFLRTTTYVAVRRYMAVSDKSSIRVKCGAATNRVRPPKFFRSCPLCDRENREKDAETCWRRLFQLPGVEVCVRHGVFLEPSDLRLDPLPNRHKYLSAESARLSATPHSINTKDSIHQILIDLARDIEWLLKQERLNPGLDVLHARYSDVLTQKGFVTKAGSVRMAELRQEVRSRYGEKLLELLQSELPDAKGVGWLGHLLRKANTAVAPLRHLLLLRVLDVDLERFFLPTRPDQISDSPRNAAGPWPCLNPICQHSGKVLISQADLQPPDTNGNRHFVVKCPHCGFSYQIREGVQNPTWANRIIDYGPEWKSVLKQQWANTNVTLRQMAKLLGVDPKTVKQRAAELGLLFPRKGKRPVTRRGLYVARKRDTARSIESHRHTWDELRCKNPAAGTKQLRLLAPALYAWLYRNDRVWLTEHQPPRKGPPVARAQVDWARRDEELVGEIATVAAHIKHRPGKPRRVTVTAIGRVLGKQSLFEAALAKLPLTRSVIKSVLESNEDFTVRRIYAAAAKLRKAEGTFPRWKLTRAAGLHYRLERQPRIKAALDYETRPFAEGLILKDGDSVLEMLIQPPRQIPVRVHPLQVVRLSSLNVS